MDREELGKLVRKVWVEYCLEIGDTKPSHIAGWDELSEQDKEADRRIGEALQVAVIADQEEILKFYEQPIRSRTTAFAGARCEHHAVSQHGSTWCAKCGAVIA